MTYKTGGPAFPLTGYGTRNAQGVEIVHAHGMTLRDYFAIHARMTDEAFGSDQEEVARRYEFADAMLAERAK